MRKLNCPKMEGKCMKQRIPVAGRERDRPSFRNKNVYLIWYTQGILSTFDGMIPVYKLRHLLKSMAQFPNTPNVDKKTHSAFNSNFRPHAWTI